MNKKETKVENSQKINNQDIDYEIDNENIIDEITDENLDENVDETINDEEKFASLDEEFKIKMQNLVDEANEKAKESEDKYLRTHANFENIKKRLEREKYSAIDYASEEFAKDLLAPIDALQMAILSADANTQPALLVEKLKEGMELTVKAFNKAFEKHNIIEVEYDEFNPEFHNAVMKVDSQDKQSGQIVQIMQKGYKIKDRLLREAMVSIAN